MTSVKGTKLARKPMRHTRKARQKAAKLGGAKKGRPRMEGEEAASFYFVTERLATGCRIASDRDVARLIEAGITHVINAASELGDTRRLSHHPQIAYLDNGTPDDGKKKPLRWFKKSIDFALAALSRPGTKVLAHCYEGCNRGPSTAYAILRAQGLPPDQAERQIRKSCPEVGASKECLMYKADADAAVVALGYAPEAAPPARRGQHRRS